MKVALLAIGGAGVVSVAIAFYLKAIPKKVARIQDTQDLPITPAQLQEPAIIEEPPHAIGDDEFTVEEEEELSLSHRLQKSESSTSASPNWRTLRRSVLITGALTGFKSCSEAQERRRLARQLTKKSLHLPPHPTDDEAIEAVTSAEEVAFARVTPSIPDASITSEMYSAVKDIDIALGLRMKHHYPSLPSTPLDVTLPNLADDALVFKSGVIQLPPIGVGDADTGTIDDFLCDIHTLRRIASDGPASTYAHARLKLLEHLYKLHRVLNGVSELDDIRARPRDIIGVPKVDTHVHLSTAPTAQHLLRFIRKKLQDSPDVVVLDSKATLADLIKRTGVPPEEINLDTLHVVSEFHNFQRLDKAEETGSPSADLRKVFLSIDNELKGKWYGELVKEMFQVQLDGDPTLHAEYRLTMYGEAGDWHKLAEWVSENKLHHPRAKWIICIPRVYSQLRRSGKINAFHELIENIFRPVFEATLNPTAHSTLVDLLRSTVAFDLYGNENTAEVSLGSGVPSADQWTSAEEPPFLYWLWYLHANLFTLNRVRESKGMPAFALRPHAGESGSITHLLGSYLVSDGISHGLKLRSSPCLEYLFLLSRIPVTMSPLANNALVMGIDRHPYQSFFRRGLTVSLSTDSPLATHMTLQPLIEELSSASATWRFSQVDLAEMVRTSVLTSGLDHATKKKLLGPRYLLDGADGNDVNLNNVPDIRAAYRFETLANEFSMLDQVMSQGSSCPCYKQPDGRSLNYALLDFDLGESFAHTSEDVTASVHLEQARAMRLKYRSPAIAWRPEHAINPSSNPLQSCQVPKDVLTTNYTMGSDGVMRVYESDGSPLCKIPSFDDFLGDLQFIISLCVDGREKALSFRRLKLLSWMFSIHTELNAVIEQEAMVDDPRDFSSINIVDNHVHLASCMTAQHLKEFIIDKVRNHGNDIVTRKDGQDVTLAKVFSDLGFTTDSFSIDRMGVLADHSTFHRFDLFNAKFSVAGSSDLRTIFLKTSNAMAGKYFSQLSSQVMDEHMGPYTAAEYRVSVYGFDLGEWDRLAHWACQHNMYRPNVRYLVQIPRLYWLAKRLKKVTSFQELLVHIFQPLFDACSNPGSHPELWRFLMLVVGIDSVDNEANPERQPSRRFMPPLPSTWTGDENPPYAYWTYFFQANLLALNALRRKRLLPPLRYRPHAGESGALSHLAATYLCADGINHGILLDKSPVLQYLYYLDQIPISCSPISNNALFTGLVGHPFEDFFKRGLNISLSTDDPLQFHMCHVPLHEEYSVCANVWHLSQCDLSEIARASVMMSGFEDPILERMLGPLYRMEGPAGNDVCLTNVPDMRIAFRHANLSRERGYVRALSRAGK